MVSTTKLGIYLGCAFLIWRGTNMLSTHPVSASAVIVIALAFAFLIWKA